MNSHHEKMSKMYRWTTSLKNLGVMLVIWILFYVVELDVQVVQ